MTIGASEPSELIERNGALSEKHRNASVQYIIVKRCLFANIVYENIKTSMTPWGGNLGVEIVRQRSCVPVSACHNLSVISPPNVSDVSELVQNEGKTVRAYNYISGLYAL